MVDTRVVNAFDAAIAVASADSIDRRLWLQLVRDTLVMRSTTRTYNETRVVGLSLYQFDE